MTECVFCKIVARQIPSSVGPVSGGAIAVTQGTVRMRNSTLTGNDAHIHGGGLFGRDLESPTVEMNNCTIAGNRILAANNGRGGGIFVDDTNPGEPAVAFGNTIVAGNLSTNSPPSDDIYGRVTSRGWNLIGDVDANPPTEILGDTTGNLTGTHATPLDPQLGALQDNGGIPRRGDRSMEAPSCTPGTPPPLRPAARPARGTTSG